MWDGPHMEGVLFCFVLFLFLLPLQLQLDYNVHVPTRASGAFIIKGRRGLATCTRYNNCSISPPLPSLLLPNKKKINPI